MNDKELRVVLKLLGGRLDSEDIRRVYKTKSPRRVILDLETRGIGVLSGYGILRPRLDGRGRNFVIKTGVLEVRKAWNEAVRRQTILRTDLLLLEE